MPAGLGEEPSTIGIPTGGVSGHKLRRQRLRLSRWVWHEERDGQHALLHGIRLTQARLNTAAWELIRKLSDGGCLEDTVVAAAPTERDGYLACVETLCRGGFLIADEREDEALLEESRRKYVLSRPSIVTLYLLLTYCCNLRCRYCFIRGNIADKPQLGQTSMTPEVAETSVNVFARNCEKLQVDKKVIIYGGEPLLNFPVLEVAVRALRDAESLGRFHDGAVHITVITNALLLDKPRLEFLARHNVSIGISVDGPANVHDAMRVDASGRGTYAQVAHAIDLCRSMGVSWTVSCTLGTHNAPVLRQCVKHFVEDLGARNIGFNLIYTLENGTNPGDLPIDTAMQAMMGTEEYLLAQGIEESRYARRRYHLRHRVCRPYDCTGCGGQIIITPDGLAGPCHAYSSSRKYCVPLTEDMDVHELPAWQEWARRSPWNMPECYRSCPLIGLCGGGCPYAADARCGSIWCKDERCCREVELAVKEAVWENRWP
jgi:uncharacterized protein